MPFDGVVRRNRPAQAVLWVLGAAAAFQAGAVFAKMLGGVLPAPEVTFFRAAGGLLLLALAWRTLRDLRRLRDPLLHLARGGLGALALLCLMHAYASAPIALVTLIFFTRGLLMLPVAALCLGERAGRDLWAATLVGMLGLLVALVPALRAPELTSGAVAALVAAVASAGSQVVVRRLTQSNSIPVIVAVFALTCSAALAAPAAAVWVTPTTDQLLLLLGIAAFGALAQVLAGNALARAPASYLGPFGFVELPLAAVTGWALAGEIPAWSTVAGSAIVLSATVYITSIGDRYRT